MRTFLNHIENETLDEIKTSLENLWQQMIQLSEFFQYSFVLILKRMCLVRASRVRSGESGTPSTVICTRWSSWRYELGCDTPVIWGSGSGNSAILPPKSSDQENREETRLFETKTVAYATASLRLKPLLMPQCALCLK